MPSNQEQIQKIGIAAGLVVFGLFGMYGTSGSSAEVSSFSESDEAQSANSFDKIQVAARIMPSQNTEGNMILLNAMNNESDFQKLYSSDMPEEALTSTWFSFKDTAEYFPSLHFREEYAPLGTSKPYCLHLEWIRKEQRQLIDRYYHVQGFPSCSGASNSKTRWQESDPKTGLDFKPWRQIATDANSESDCVENAVFVQLGEDAQGKCYSYEVLQALCVEISYAEHPDTASYSWDYETGCFNNGEIALYQPAVTGETYKFDKLPIEVRQTSINTNQIALKSSCFVSYLTQDQQICGDSSTEVTNANGLTFVDVLFWLFFLSFVAGIVFFVISFKDQIQDLANQNKQPKHVEHVDED